MRQLLDAQQCLDGDRGRFIEVVATDTQRGTLHLAGTI
jgi:hypothetical protein